MQRLIAFLRGVFEFRRDCTWADPARGAEDWYTDLDEAYDRGREAAHRATFRHWDR